MPETPLPWWEKTAYSCTLIVSLAMLAVLLFVVPDRCGQGDFGTISRFVCTVESGLFTFREACVLIALYAVYKLFLERYTRTDQDEG